MRTVVFTVSLILVGLPLCLLAAIGLLVFFDPNDQWQVPPSTDLIMAVLIFCAGVAGFAWLKEDKKNELIRRVEWPDMDQERHSGLRRR
jgi:multisubunit Na+/H+ antiporter MnhG subunit